MVEVEPASGGGAGALKGVGPGSTAETGATAQDIEMFGEVADMLAKSLTVFLYVYLMVCLVPGCDCI